MFVRAMKDDFGSVFFCHFERREKSPVQITTLSRTKSDKTFPSSRLRGKKENRASGLNDFSASVVKPFVW